MILTSFSLKKITYNAVSAARTKLSFLIPNPALYPNRMIQILIATLDVPFSEVDESVYLYLIQY